MKKTTNAIVVKKLKELITKKIETLASTYCAYRASLKSYEERPDLFLEEDTTKRTSVLAKELIALTHETEMVLSIYLNAAIRIVDASYFLKYQETKEIKCSFYITERDAAYEINHGEHTFPVYFIYNTQTHKYRFLNDKK